MTNLATEYLRANNETLADYDGFCGELANAVMRHEDHCLYVEGDIPWKYHMVYLRDGLVHDAWCEGDALSPKEWLIKMFGPRARVVVSLDGEDVFFGLCKDFREDFSSLIERGSMASDCIEEDPHPRLLGFCVGVPGQPCGRRIHDNEIGAVELEVDRMSKKPRGVIGECCYFKMFPLVKIKPQTASQFIKKKKKAGQASAGIANNRLKIRPDEERRQYSTRRQPWQMEKP